MSRKPLPLPFKQSFVLAEAGAFAAHEDISGGFRHELIVARGPGLSFPGAAALVFRAPVNS
jgi:hypothetical protein